MYAYSTEGCRGVVLLCSHVHLYFLFFHFPHFISAFVCIVYCHYNEQTLSFQLFLHECRIINQMVLGTWQWSPMPHLISSAVQVDRIKQNIEAAKNRTHDSDHDKLLVTPSATVVSAEPFSHGTGTLRCLQK